MGVPPKHKFSFKDIEESLEKFSDEEHKDVNEWIQEFEENTRVFGRTTDDVYKRILQNCLPELRPKTWDQFCVCIFSWEFVCVNAKIHLKIFM